MISPNCDHCGGELDNEGGIVISPPHVVALGHTLQLDTVWSKKHICTKCWSQFESWLMTPHGGVEAMTLVCQKVLELDKIVSLHESFAFHWEAIVAKAKEALTFKGGGIMRQ